MSNHKAQKVFREISLHSQLTSIKGNVFTVRLLDIIIPGVENIFSKQEKDEEEVDSFLEPETPNFVQEEVDSPL